jgi:hypothetical protein
MLMTYVPRASPAALRFQRNGTGKPLLSWPAALNHSGGAALQFNLSHTRDLIGESGRCFPSPQLCMSIQPTPAVRETHSTS